MNIVKFRGTILISISEDKGSNIVRLYNKDTGEYEDYLIQDCCGCDLCCLWEDGLTPSQAGSCRFRTSPCEFFGYRPLKRMDKILEDL